MFFLEGFIMFVGAYIGSSLADEGIRRLRIDALDTSDEVREVIKRFTPGTIVIYCLELILLSLLVSLTPMSISSVWIGFAVGIVVILLLYFTSPDWVKQQDQFTIDKAQEKISRH